MKHFLLIALTLVSTAQAQVRIVASSPGTNEVALGENYVQNFNALPTSGSVTWTDNTTVPGWYANLTRGQVSTGNLVATSLTSLSAVAAGAVGGSATLNSLANTGTTDRALGGTPSVYTTGSSNIFSSQSVNVVLRMKNSTGGVLTGMKVAYDTVATSTGNKDAVAFAYRVFTVGSGMISSNFIETHRYLNTFNGVYTESMRTEFGRNVASTGGWTCVVKDIAPTSTNRVNSLSFTLRDLAVSPGDEVWLAWHICKEDEQGASDPITTTGIDNVTIGDFTVGRPGLPVVLVHPRSLEVATGGTRDFALSVSAKGGGLSYQWRKNGTNIAGATASTYTATNVNSTYEGIYDCVVTNANGSVTSLPAKVNIYARATVTNVNDVSFASYSTGISQLEAAAGGTLCDLYYPSTLTPTSTKVPAVIVIHGGGGNNGDKSDTREVDASQELAARGFFVMTINYAMSSSTVQCWPYNLWDAKQAVRWLKQKSDAGTYAVDKNKIGVVGFSWGCNMGSMLAMTGPADDVGVSTSSLRVEPPSRGNSYDSYSTAVQCAAVFYGATDLPNYHQMNQFLDFTAWDNRTLYRRASPVRYPNANAAPMFVAHGSADDDVWQSQTECTYNMQRSVKANLENYLQVPGGEHSFGLYETTKIAAGFPNPIDVRPETLGFLAKHLVETTRRPAILQEPVSAIVNAGSTAVFSVEANGTPAPTYQWRKDGVNISGATSASYSVAAGSTTGGYYDVIVTNSVGSITSTAGLLTVIGSSTNVPPVAVNDSATTTPGNPVTVNVLTNDSDSDGGTLSIISTTQGTNGTVTNTSTTVTYTPNVGFSGSDSFNYTITDGQGDTDSATVNVTVTAGSTTNVTVAAAGTVESTNPTTDINEATLGYVSTKYNAAPATSAARKAYFQFDVSTLSVNSGGTATFTVNFTNSFQQNVQLWALNQAFAGDVSTLTWNTAPANEPTTNNMLTSGGTSATAIGSATLIPAAYPNPATFSISNIGNYVQGGKVVLVLTGVTHASNNSSGARYNRTNATLTMPVTGATNSSPTISDITNRTIVEDGSTSVITFTIGDAETAAADLVVTAASSNTNKIPVSGIVLGGSGANRTVQVFPAANQVGQATVTLTVTDAGGASNGDSFIVTITQVNDAPTISDIADQTINVNTSTGDPAFTIGDIETTPSSLVITGSSSNTTLVPNANIVFGGADASRTVNVTPAANQSGSATITVTVSDGALSASDTFVLTVNAVLPPIETWRTAQFGANAGNPAIAGDTADPNNNGVVNLMEYALNGNPMSNGPLPLPVVTTAGGGLGTVFTRAVANTDITMTVQASDNPNGPWTDLTSSVGGGAFSVLAVGASVNETGSGATRSVTVQDIYTTNTAPNARRFMRLIVTRP